VVVSTLYKEAIDIPTLDGLVNAGAGKSSIAFYQQLRNMTAAPGKRIAPVLDFADRGRFLASWARQRLSMAEREDAFRCYRLTDYVSGRTGPQVYAPFVPALTGGPDLLPK
jgi:superfamily II DNA or RNA helicase